MGGLLQKQPRPAWHSELVVLLEAQELLSQELPVKQAQQELQPQTSEELELQEQHEPRRVL